MLYSQSLAIDGQILNYHHVFVVELFGDCTITEMER